MIIDIASLVFVCVTMNHLGLISAIEAVTKIHHLPIVSCPKCMTFWCVLAYTIINTHDIITSLAISFLSSYLAIWLELLEGYIDTIYIHCYGKIIKADNVDTTASDANDGYSAGTLSDL